MFIGMFVGGSDSNQAQLAPRARRRRNRQPLRNYLVELWRHPNRALSDIAFERPWPQGLALLAGGLALSGSALGGTGLPGVASGVAGIPTGAIAGLLIGTMAFVVATLAFHGMALVLEGAGALTELASAFLFAMLPVYAIVPAAVLRLLPGGWGDFAFSTACFVIGLWTLRLTYLAIREGHRFSGIQAGLTITGTLLATMLGAIVVFFGTAIFVLLT
jgi:hypothetical protein